ncbi:glycosyltransferase [Ruminococcus sp. HUN007]|uniref:glycosyltransferase family 2 protein n=1 Tax=Ruminococcus sp. HUN007 TaxID=1514668 RepID=UPI0005D1A0C8|nr:glycosyltransferase [Ruminococcus sp. HUN007]
MYELIEVNTSKAIGNEIDGSIYQVREQIANYNLKDYESEVTILVQTYNGLNKTKKCVESILKTISGIDCDLWLIDNGSTDGTLEYFKNVEYEKKTYYSY